MATFSNLKMGSFIHFSNLCMWRLSISRETKVAPLFEGSSREAGEGSFPWSFLAGTNSVREICRTYESPSLGVGFLRFKGLIWGLPEVYLRFEGLMVK